MIYSIVIFISFLLEGLISNIIPFHSPLFQNCFTLVSLLVLYPYFYNRQSLFFTLAFISGMLLDITYTNTLFLNGLLFLLMAYFIKKLNIWISSNTINDIFLTIIIIILYRTISYFVLMLINNYPFNFNLFATSITSSLILNIIYAVFLSFVMDKLRIKFHLIKVE